MLCFLSLSFSKFKTIKIKIYIGLINLRNKEKSWLYLNKFPHFKNKKKHEYLVKFGVIAILSDGTMLMKSLSWQHLE